MQRSIGWNLAFVLALAAGSGCCCMKDRRKPQAACPQPACLPGPAQQPMVAPAPAPPQPNFPPLSPQAQTPVPQTQMPVPQDPMPAGPPGGMQPPPSAPPPPPQKVEYRWQPAPETAQLGNSNSTQLGTPEPLTPEAKDKLKLYPPESPEPEKTQPAQKETSPFPVGIPNFSPAKDQISSGLRPSLDGLDWLQANGYRTILFVRGLGVDDSTDKKQIEKRGLKYLSLEVSPATLSPQIVDDFNQIVNAAKNYPLFVYDRDGALAGGLWFLHFRGANASADDSARVRAGSLGFREDRDDTHRAMWLAIQKLLSK